MKVCYAHEKLDKLRWNILNAVFILLSVSVCFLKRKRLFKIIPSPTT